MTEEQLPILPDIIEPIDPKTCQHDWAISHACRVCDKCGLIEYY